MLNDSADSHEDEEHEGQTLILSKLSRTTVYVIQVVVAALLAALSVAVTPLAAFIPRIPLFGIALFDPISIFWIIAFLIGGIWVGLFSMSLATIVLNFFDPTAPFGPLLKFFATMPHVLIPWLVVTLVVRGRGRGFLNRFVGSSNDGKAGRLLSNAKLYFVLMIIAALIRMTMMVPINLVVVPIMWGASDPGFIISFTLAINAVQAIGDAVVPFIVVHLTPVYDTVGMW
jgi:hypothetical protein